jgi:hypothetical protein
VRALDKEMEHRTTLSCARCHNPNSWAGAVSGGATGKAAFVRESVCR